MDRSRIGSTRDEPPAAADPSPIMPATLRNRTDRTPASPSKSAGMDADGGPRGPAAIADFFLPPVPDCFLHSDGSSTGEDAAGPASSSAIELRLLLLTDDPGPRARSSPPPPLSPPPPAPPLSPPLPLPPVAAAPPRPTSPPPRRPFNRMDPWTESNVEAVASSSATTGGAFRGGGASGGNIKSSHPARQWSRTDWPPRLRLVLDRRDKRADGPSASSTWLLSVGWLIIFIAKLPMVGALKGRGRGGGAAICQDKVREGRRWGRLRRNNGGDGRRYGGAVREMTTGEMMAQMGMEWEAAGERKESHAMNHAKCGWAFARGL